ncbi:hypothetical protein J5X98_08755 [Leptothermofonsia sichuanensis E412]|uniref:hypothetical protein n=1 Tax=Leptothermofonsia sichuanensis TaxID=2917832 RepID=UPI001CA73149|nr:hypothetical protein [Leptothermofonsia sichuanensis]QZZ22444.1 hypothetical protein J5X98_08755 [Leptothermofonsia sichuanensis E412]
MRKLLLGGAIACFPFYTAYPSVPASPRTSSPTQKPASRQPPPFIRPRVTCPARVEPLTTALLRDLPHYLNRVHLRQLHRQTGGLLYAIVASQPDFTPLPAQSREYNNPVDENLHQVFFTVLERQYIGQHLEEYQHYHWLFLTKTRDGWRIALMFSHVGSYPNSTQPLTVPRESSDSLTAQAIRLWLRDCQAGAVRL